MKPSCWSVTTGKETIKVISAGENKIGTISCATPRPLDSLVWLTRPNSQPSNKEIHFQHAQRPAMKLGSVALAELLKEPHRIATHLTTPDLPQKRFLTHRSLSLQARNRGHTHHKAFIDSQTSSTGSENTYATAWLLGSASEAALWGCKALSYGSSTRKVIRQFSSRQQFHTASNANKCGEASSRLALLVVSGMHRNVTSALADPIALDAGSVHAIPFGRKPPFL